MEQKQKKLESKLLWFECDVTDSIPEHIKFGNVGQAGVNRTLDTLRKLVHFNSTKQVKCDIFHKTQDSENKNHQNPNMQRKQFGYDPKTMSDLKNSEVTFFMNKCLAPQDAQYLFPSSRPNLCLCFSGPIGRVIFVHDFLVEGSLHFVKKELAYQAQYNKDREEEKEVDQSKKTAIINPVQVLNMHNYCERAVRILLSYCYTGVLACPPMDLKTVHSLVKECKNEELDHAFEGLRMGGRRCFEVEKDEYEVEERVGSGSFENPTIVEFENVNQVENQLEYEPENKPENNIENKFEDPYLDKPENEPGNEQVETEPKQISQKNYENEPTFDLTLTPNIRASQKTVSQKNAQKSLQVDEIAEESSQKMKRLSVNELNTTDKKRVKTSAAGIISGNYTSDENIEDDARTEFLSDSSDGSIYGDGE